MKKTFLRCGSLLVAAFVLFGAVFLAAPVKASAAENEYTVSGVWVLNENITEPVFAFVPFTCNGVSYDGFSYSSMAFLFGAEPVNNNTTFSDLIVVYYFVDPVGWKDSSYRTIDFGFDDVVVSESFYDWLVANATFQAPLPGPGPLVEVMTDLQEQNQLSQVLTQVVTMIPIGLACWVGYKGLRKGLAMLAQKLHQA